MRGEGPVGYNGEKALTLRASAKPSAGEVTRLPPKETAPSNSQSVCSNVHSIRQSATRCLSFEVIRLVVVVAMIVLVQTFFNINCMRY